MAVDSIARARYWANRAIWAEAEATGHLPSLQGDYGTVFEGEDPNDRRPGSALRWGRIYRSLLRALEDGLTLGAFGLTTNEVWAREVRGVRARAVYWELVLTPGHVPAGGPVGGRPGPGRERFPSPGCEWVRGRHAPAAVPDR